MTLFEALEHLVLAGGGRELGAPVLDLRLALNQLLRVGAALCLDPLQEGLACDQFAGVEGARLGGDAALFEVRGLQVLLDAAQLVLRARAQGDRLGELLLGELLLALAYGTHAFEAKAKRGTVHGLVIGCVPMTFRSDAQILRPRAGIAGPSPAPSAAAEPSEPGNTSSASGISPIGCSTGTASRAASSSSCESACSGVLR